MAISRGAGTEVIRSAHFEDVDSTNQILIVGVQHHIYTVLSVIIQARTLQSAGNYIRMGVHGYDSKAGATDQDIYIFQQEMQVGETFVWNDKFSFNGYEPTDFSGPLDDATKQDAIADQGSSVSQNLFTNSEHADDTFDVTVTYLDLNNA
tara:strand:- start:46 stop:495 length:450 start_codon:yes stop_codon:yes gene_type:complete